MYLEYYNLEKEPFHITPDPEFLFLTESHKEALASIIYAVERKKGFVQITGGVGVGKTTILRAFLDRIDRQRLKMIYVFNPNVTFKGLVNTIYQELGIKPPSDDLSEMVRNLHLILIEEYSAGHDVVLVIDEAQNMPIDTLENLRMLSNLETSTDKLIQIALIGQPELEEMLDRHELRQLKQRIAIRARISFLTREESFAYIEYRLRKAGLHDDPTSAIFTKKALKLIVNQANGIPRTINILCDNALVTGFGKQEHPVGAQTVKEVISDSGEKRKWPLIRKWQYATVFSLVVLFFIFFVSPFGALFISSIKDFSGSSPEPVALKKEIPLIPKEIEDKKGEIAPATKEAKPQQEVLKEIPPPNVTEEKKEAKPEREAFKETSTPKVIEAKKKQVPAVRKVKQGDGLIQLIEDVYGIHDRKLIINKLVPLVKQSNPKIKNVNKLPVGDKIIFPDISKIHIKVDTRDNP